MNMPNISGYERVKEALMDVGSVSFPHLLSLIIDIPLDGAAKDELVSATSMKVQHLLELGNFSDLEGLGDFLSLLGVEKISFNDTWTKKLMALYHDTRLTLALLLRLYPTLIDGKLTSGGEYDKLIEAEKILQSEGFSSQELTDEYVAFLWSVRELLIKMRHNQDEVKKVLNMYLGVDLEETNRPIGYL